MNPPFWSRFGRKIALGLIPLAADSATGQAPPPDVSTTQPAAAAPARRGIEIYHGTNRVGWVMPPAIHIERPLVVMPAPAPITVQAPVATPVATPAIVPPTITDAAAAARVSEAVAETLNAVREGTRRVSTATTELLERMGDRGQAAHPIPPIYPATYVQPAAPALPPHYMPAAPWLMPAPHAPAGMAKEQATPPQVVIIREPGEARASTTASHAAPVSEGSRGITVTPETLLGLGIGVAGIGIGVAGWRRSSREKAAALVMPTPPPSVPADGVLLMGKYNAGRRPEPAEKFEIGPTYQDEQLSKLQVESESQNAVLEFILSQNLALHAELAGPDLGADMAPPVTEAKTTALGN